MPAIQRALISVSDKTGLTDFAYGLAALGAELISTGGTARHLREAGLTVTDISAYTGFPEILDGRVKTLHPKVHGGLLYRRTHPDHVKQAEQFFIPPIDLVCVNLYPFEQTIRKAGISLDDAIEQIDIGGPSMIRSAAKNWESVTVVVDPSDYEEILDEIKKNGNNTLRETRLRLAAKVFATASRYDGAICAYLEANGEDAMPPTFTLQGVLKVTLRYGENPHQKNAALYAIPGYTRPCVAQGMQISGKEIGFNNLLDMNTAFEIVREFKRPAACVVKHNNPCGAACADDILDAWTRAFAGDPLSAFGGVLAFNRQLNSNVAEQIVSEKGFKADAIVAPSFSANAKEILTTRKKWGASVILLEVGAETAPDQTPIPASGIFRDVRTIPGGILVQTPDTAPFESEFAALKIVTQRAPTEEELSALKFAWIICKHVKSNAIVLAKNEAVVGVGAGQMSRVDSVHIALAKAGDKAKGAALASDAFFPFPDGPESAAQAGVTAIIQPGGSVKDDEVIAVANAHNIAMVFTGVRHFRH
ncbi:MAG TPA: bifunctional phosphoribosylaminoimidazolecarboxamide formyltransferase/IMP cyclohydrolase [Planctomycetota bacterium]|nr:bifunctional phosphoribosylaminoimidazolecarboxamide formyltransferase/IMP cyclohydrolase [Planctomycetota bacterium]